MGKTANRILIGAHMRVCGAHVAAKLHAAVCTHAVMALPATLSVVGRCMHRLVLAPAVNLLLRADPM